MARQDSITALIDQMVPPRYTVTRAAAMVGRSTDTLTRWRRQGLCFPSDERSFGKVVVHLYTDKDIELLRDLAEVQRPGRKSSDAKKSLSHPHRKVAKEIINEEEEPHARKKDQGRNGRSR